MGQISYLDDTLQLAVVRAARIWSSVAPCGDESRSKLPGAGAGDTKHLLHAAETDLFLKPQVSEGRPPGSNPLWRS